jgi:hypothetical protein
MGKPLIAVIPKPKVSGRVTLGPVPGTPEFDFEQRCKRAGLRYVRWNDPDRSLLETRLTAIEAQLADTQRSGE